MSEKWTTPFGEANVAVEELALFFNNNTIDWGYDALSTGMTKDEAIQALLERGFDDLLAEAFLKKMLLMCNVFWDAGKLYMPGKPHERH